MGNHIILYRATNSKGKHDATGAFEPEARALKRLIEERYPDSNVIIEGVDLEALRDLPRAEKRKAKHGIGEDALSRAFDRLPNPVGDVDSLSFFCHGYRDGIEFYERGIYGAESMARLCEYHNIKYLNLFACSTAEPHENGNFCYWVVKEAICFGHDLQVLGHETPGHTSWNAILRFYWSANGETEWSGALHTGEHQLLTTEDKFDGFQAMMKKDQHYRLLLPYMLDE